MPDILTYKFFWNALLAGVLSGLSCGLIGVFVVTMRIPFIGVCMSHAAFAGVILATLLGLPEQLSAIVLAVGSALATGHIAGRAGMTPAISLNIIFAFTMSLVFLGIGLLGDKQVAFELMWGNILAVSSRALVWTALTALVTIALVIAMFGHIRAIVYDRTIAAAAGMRETLVYYMLLSVMALTVTANLSAIGGLIMFGLIICPAAAAYQLTYRLSLMCLLAALFGALSAVLGLVGLSYPFNLPSGASIVLMSVAVFCVCALVSPKRRRFKQEGVKTEENG